MGSISFFLLSKSYIMNQHNSFRFSFIYMIRINLHLNCILANDSTISVMNQLNLTNMAHIESIAFPVNTQRAIITLSLKSNNTNFKDEKFFG